MKRILIINSAPFTLEFVQPIVTLFHEQKIAHELVDFDQIPEDKNSYNGIIISASPKCDDILNSQLPYYEWLKDCQIPVIGSCHGHQMMGIIFGSEVLIHEEAEEGLHSVSTIKADHLFHNMEKTFDAEQHHVKSITLPINFERLASSKQCKVQIMKHKYRMMYGLQFHLESNPRLINNFVTICQA